MHMGTSVHWGRLVIAAILSEVAVIPVLGIVFMTHRFVIAPGRTKAEYDAFVARASYCVAPTAAGIAVFCSALWAVRSLTSGFVLNGTLVGVIAVVLTVGFLFSAKPGERMMYGVSFLLRILGGCLGGVLAQFLV